jgi:hypothetical protein
VPDHSIEDLLAERGITVSREAIQVTDQYANNLAELSHQPTRTRERAMCGPASPKFKPHGQAQRFPGVHVIVYKLFNPGRQLVRARHYRDLRESALGLWAEAVVWDWALGFFWPVVVELSLPAALFSDNYFAHKVKCAREKAI